MAASWGRFLEPSSRNIKRGLGKTWKRLNSSRKAEANQARLRIDARILCL
jgi:hypothetical protein